MFGDGDSETEMGDVIRTVEGGERGERIKYIAIMHRFVMPLSHPGPTHQTFHLFVILGFFFFVSKFSSSNYPDSLATPSSVLLRSPKRE